MPDASDESIPPKLIDDALERVLASRGFRGSARKQRFLKFVVDETQAGHADRIKAFTIAMDVFDRDASFDPLLDPVVRIQAGRIRRCLEQYYLTEGAADPVQITIPKGGYVPHFIVKRHEPAAAGRAAPAGAEPLAVAGEGADPAPATMAEAPPEAPEPPKRPPRLAALTAARRHALPGGGILVAVLFALLGAVWLAAPAPQPPREDKSASAMRGPALMVMPFANGTGNPAQDIVAEGFTEDLVGALIRFRSVFVFGARTAFRVGPAGELRKAAPDADVDYILKGSVNQTGDQIQITAALVSARDQRYVWSNGYRGAVTSSNLVDVRQDIAVQVARALLQSHGVIDKEEMRATATLAPAALSSHGCMLRTRQYWRQPNAELHGQARTCLERVVKADPQYADAWAALAMVYFDEALLGLNPVKARPDPVAVGLPLAVHAAALAPDNPLPNRALGLAHWLRGEPGAGIAAYETALALNPEDSDALADLGRCYSLMGDWDRGIPLLREAFARNPALSDRYRITIALYHYVQGRYDDALAEAKRSDLPGLVFPHAVLAMIHGQAGRSDAAAREVAEILRLEPAFAAKAIAEFERRNINPATIARMADGLRKAGIDVSPQWASTDGR